VPAAFRFTSKDLGAMPQIEGIRYEIIDEYWIVGWRARQVEVYRRADGDLRLVVALASEHTLTSPLLPGFSCSVTTLWATAGS